jgi:ribonuclease D
MMDCCLYVSPLLPCLTINKFLPDFISFQVDLEHNQYRSFQGLTCLMQISTRTEDFIVDTLKLRIYIGLYLQAPFKDPTKRKVLKNSSVVLYALRFLVANSFFVK